MEDGDTHLCLNCHLTIVGLENYVQHRKTECVVCTLQNQEEYEPNHADNTTKCDSNSPTVLTVSTSLPPVSSILTPTTSDIVDHSLLLYDSHDTSPRALNNFPAAKSQAGIEDFLSSLELQARDSKDDKQAVADESKSSDQVIDDRLKTLKIANILNELDFSSDSDGLPSDVDELLDYADEEYHPRGGKWASGGKVNQVRSPGKQMGGKSGKLRHSASKHSGKWKPSEKLQHKKKQDVEEVDNRDKKKTLECKTCLRVYKTEMSYDRHMKTRLHLKKMKENSVKIKTEVECPICDKTFNNKYNFARHLVSRYHSRREVAQDALLLDETLQHLLLKQSPIQCRICSFYCNRVEVMIDHLNSESHNQRTERVTGPLLCVRCRYKANNNTMLIAHVSSSEHEAVVQSSERPCILREARYNVECHECKRIFHSMSQLERHLFSAHQIITPSQSRLQLPKSYKMPCPYCNKIWTSRLQLNVHIRRSHSEQKPFLCAPCQLAFTNPNSLRTHQASRRHLKTQVLSGNMDFNKAVKLIPVGSRNSCRYCEFVGLKYSEVKTHYKREHPEMLNRCKACMFETFLDEVYARHIKSTSHQKKKMQKSGEYRCEVCQEQFTTENKCRIHALRHTTVISEKQLRQQHGGDPMVGVDKRFHEFAASLRNMSCKNTTKITCIECHQKIGILNMMNHLRKHSNSFPFQCSKCIHKFPSSSSLRRHMFTVHLAIKLHACPHCDLRFARQSYLLRHLLKQHGEISEVPCPHVCSVCQKGFPVANMLHVHMVQHQKLRPFVCDWPGCNKSYKFRGELTVHHRCHTGERPYLCHLCGYSASSQQKLSRHHVTHTGERRYSCNYCSYKAQNSTHLHRHMRIHIGSRPFKCPYCPYTCNTQENVRKHILKTRIHRGLPCYPCEHCSYGTNSAHEFGKHLNKEHNQKIKRGDVLSVIAGMYVKEEDLKDIPEGCRALPIREKKKSTSIDMQSELLLKLHDEELEAHDEELEASELHTTELTTEIQNSELQAMELEEIQTSELERTELTSDIQGSSLQVTAIILDSATIKWL